MGIDQWEWEGMGILIVFPHTSTEAPETVKGKGGQANVGGARGLEYSPGLCWTKL